jgi:GxxExxY protein
MSVENEQFKHSGVTKKVIGVFYQVYNELGSGFLESVYENSLAIALKDAGLDARQQINIPVSFRGTLVGSFCADMLVNDVVLLELKVARSIEQAHIGQLMNYLKATAIEVGMVLNFGPKPEFRRIAFGNERKVTDVQRIQNDPLASASSAVNIL